MARIICSADITEQSAAAYSVDERLWIYNGLDACVTHEVHQRILSEVRASPNAQIAYKFSRGMSGPALRMMLRGFAIDLDKRGELLQTLGARYNTLFRLLTRFGVEVFGIADFNPGSRFDWMKVFYEIMGLPVQYKFNKVKKERTPSVDRESLEKLELYYYYAGPLIRMLLAMRDCKKKIEVLETGLSHDNRLRCSYNIVGTKFSRWSSSTNVFGGGTNLQNVTDEMREVFIPDPGWKLGYADLEQAESVCVAYLSGDTAYKAAIASGDLHTTVSAMCFSTLPWPTPPSSGPFDRKAFMKQMKEIAEQKYYRHFSYRDMSKRGGHLSNYRGTPATMAAHLKMPLQNASTFQVDYFRAFTGIQNWQLKTIRDIGERMYILTPLGRKIYFFGRTSEGDTQREAISAGPQSMTGDILNLGLYNVWLYELETKGQLIQILGQVHDAIVFQYRPAYERSVLTKVLNLMKVPVIVGPEVMLIGTEVYVGWNWRKYVSESDAKKKGVSPNLFGIKKWSLDESDTRAAPTRQAPRSLLDQRVSATHRPFLLA